MQLSSSASRVLIVDDEEFNRDILEEYMKDEGIAFQSAEDGETALHILQEDKQGFDCILLDRMMPGLSGIEVLRIIKQDERLSRIPVIMQTAAASTSQIREGMQEGVYYYLTKPYTQNLLLNILESALQEGKERKELKGKFIRLQHALQFLEEASFSIRTPEEANEVAYTVACALPDPERSLTGISELLINAVEHGNLGITFHEKTKFLENGTWAAEINRRLEDPRYRDRVARLRFFRSAHACHMMISDEGNGFDYTKFLDIDPARLMLPHGRGVALSKALAFDEMQYLGCGNRVLCAVFHTADIECTPSREEYAATEYSCVGI